MTISDVRTAFVSLGWVATIFAQTSAAASGSFIDGQTLYEECLTYSNYYRNGNRTPSLVEADEIASCRRTVLVAADTADALTEAFSKPRLFCLPANIKAGTAVDIIVKWMDNNPAQRTYPASAIVILALKNAYPCQG